MEGYQVDPDALAEASQGINDTIGELKSLGIEESGEVGRGFSNISLSGLEIGHGDLQGSFDQFCERWSWGVRTLVQDGNEIAQRLGLSAGMYNDMEQYAIGTLKDLANAAGGNPHADDKKVEHESWSQLMDDQKPDYSAKSWEQAGQQIGDQWKAEGRDLAEGPYGLGKTAADAAGYGDQFSKAEDQVFGPAPKQQGGK